MSGHSGYPKYKTTGLPWIGDVPTHWVLAQLKRSVLDCRNGVWGDEAQGDENDTPVIRVADFDRERFRVSTEDANLTLRNISSKELRSRALKSGDLLLEKSGGGDRQLVGAVVSWDRSLPAVTANFIAKMTPAAEYDSRFLSYLHASLYAGRVNYRSIKQSTGIQNIDSDQYLSEKVAFPPIHEQRTIAAFLDHQTAKTDRLIAKQQRLIELLTEKRQAVISHAVTKGLNPDAPMKDSGVEWLGEVPAHWGVGRIGWWYEVQLGKMLDQRRITGRFLAPYLRNTDVQWGQINVNNLPTMDFSPLDRLRYSLKPGDLLVCEGGDIGRCAIWSHSEFECFYQKALHRVRSRSFALVEYLQHVLRLLAEQGILSGSGTSTTINHLTAEQLRHLLIPMPPPQEQREISARIQGLTEHLSTLQDKCRASIKLLREHRTALISAAVTGKVDVRNWQPGAEAAQAPEISEELHD
ncbi:restriction endonuclease subunit S [Alkalilimnicola sp. S0819]|uniref:restriction endonuclease subunit S n=1 Tax=Alkalilimnicola sp. S0819 TaxID=2613922 RepID=UPI001261D9B2|nr:restriction endonuclease subunit S [Alkalilimnicola sp. S0819]KAB7619595.1 restriction endonuclease subunit S [Alkalilimnicola sp. S0819]MPQ17598.1 restriction endonuclease subunit S [Alkalilimnicola sp. S0819]